MLGTERELVQQVTLNIDKENDFPSITSQIFKGMDLWNCIRFETNSIFILNCSLSLTTARPVSNPTLLEAFEKNASLYFALLTVPNRAKVVQILLRAEYKQITSGIATLSKRKKQTLLEVKHTSKQLWWSQKKELNIPQVIAFSHLYSALFIY